jgi:hypothetical protein
MMTVTTILLQKYRPMLSFPQSVSGNPVKTNILDARLRTPDYDIRGQASGMTDKRERYILEIKFMIINLNAKEGKFF